MRKVTRWEPTEKAWKFTTVLGESTINMKASLLAGVALCESVEVEIPEDDAEIEKLAYAKVKLDQENERLRNENDRHLSMLELYVRGESSSFQSWKEAALRLRAELKRIDPTNQTESQIDWRLEDEGSVQ